MNHYETLGVPQNASAGAIKKAYRAKARETHPDVHPEKAAEFHAVQRAYDVLSDPKAREDYHECGMSDKALEDRNSLTGTVRRLFRSIVTNLSELEGAPPQPELVLVIARDSLNKTIQEQKQEIKRLERLIAAVQPYALALAPKTDTIVDIFGDELELIVFAYLVQIRAAEQTIYEAESMLNFLKGYAYQPPKGEKPKGTFGNCHVCGVPFYDRGAPIPFRNGNKIVGYCVTCADKWAEGKTR